MTPFSSPISRRRFLRSASITAAAFALPGRSFAQKLATPLDQFGYADVDLHSEPHEKQLRDTHTLLMNLNEDSLLRPFREMSGQPAPGDNLGGWYDYRPDLAFGKDNEAFAPTATFGQWISALARSYAIRPDPAVREKVLRLNRLQAQTISGDYFDKNRFPTYCYDKLLRGLIDSHEFIADPDALSILEKLTDAALPHFPPHVADHVPWRPNRDDSWTWDESYTIAENLFIASKSGAGHRYLDLAQQYLADDYYNPLSENRSNLAGKHAYSHVNSLGSAMQAYLTLGSEKHFRAARNGFDMLLQQSYATGGWGPDEMLRAPGSPDLYNSLTNTHASFETPCGAYAHFKLARYLLRVTRESKYGDSMERVMYNTVLGAKPLRADGRTFYYSDYNFEGSKFYRPDQHWACCSGTLPEVATDYRLNLYFRDPRAVWVNLYVPSALRWQQDGGDFVLTQSGDYPFTPTIQFDLQTSHAREFTLCFRIPAWANNPSLLVNGRRADADVAPGTFASVRRHWKSGDRIELDLPMTNRLEPIDAQHSDTVALLNGPLVLFPLIGKQTAFPRADLLAAQKISSRAWQASTSSGPVKFLPFTEINDEPYSTYVQVT